LFASKSGGYWHSSDLIKWKLIPTDELPVEDYAPTVVAIGDTLYFLASSDHANIYKTTDPRSGKWTVAKAKFEISLDDPAFFLDDDNRLYLYWGSSNNAPLWGTEIDYKNGFKPIGEPVALISANPSNNGWKVHGDHNTRHNAAPWIEGAWLNKHNGKYYLQYACPGTEYKSYADGVYVAESPLGTFKQAKNNPFACKPAGFITGAGHGNTFSDKYGNYWHIGTVTISVKHMFERRLALFPSFFDAEGELHCNTALGDFPMVIPNHRIKSGDELFPGWMLLSYKKDVEVSSSLDGHSTESMTDEDIRTYWSAVTGSSDEWVKLDLGMNYDVYALQLNFAEQNTTTLGRKDGLYFKHTIEMSSDNKHWEKLVDNSENSSKNSHHYIQLEQKVKCRYLRLKNIRVADGCFALSGFRVFGKGNGNKPDKVNQFLVDRESGNRRTVHLSWKKEEKAIGYWITAHFLNAAAQFEEMGIKL